MDNTLSSLQRQMQQALISPGCDTGKQAESFIRPTSRLSAEACLSIYQRSYCSRLQSCMREQFPALCHALGASVFNDFSMDYLSRHPSTCYTLYELGRLFPDYLKATRPDSNSGQESSEQEYSEQEIWIDFMVQMASFERKMFALFDAPGHEGQRLATNDTDDKHLCLQPAVRLGRYDFPLMDYYLAVRHGASPDLPPMKITHVLLVRKEYRIHILTLTPAHATFLAAVRNGLSVTDALAYTADQLKIPHSGVLQSWHASKGVREVWLSAGLFIDTQQ